MIHNFENWRQAKMRAAAIGCRSMHYFRIDDDVVDTLTTFFHSILILRVDHDFHGRVSFCEDRLPHIQGKGGENNGKDRDHHHNNGEQSHQDRERDPPAPKVHDVRPDRLSGNGYAILPSDHVIRDKKQDHGKHHQKDREHRCIPQSVFGSRGDILRDPRCNGIDLPRCADNGGNTITGSRSESEIRKIADRVDQQMKAISKASSYSGTEP